MGEYATKSTEVDRVSVVTDISLEVERLRSVVDRAADRLTPVLSPDYGSESKTSDSSVPTPIKSYISQTSFELTMQINRLIAILDRVEV